MASTWRVVYLVSTALVVLLFSLAGLMKLTPLLSPEVHGELVSCHIIMCVNDGFHGIFYHGNRRALHHHATY